jgi:hypothetical protein
MYGILEYASFLDSSKHVIASTRHFGRILRYQVSFKKIVLVTRQKGAE